MATPIANDGIVAQAFRLMKMPAVSSLQDSSDEAQAALAQYPVALDFCLELCDWSFVSTLADLAEATAAITDADFPYAYVLPSACVNLREVQPHGVVRWRRDGDFLRTDEPTLLRVRYTRRETNEGRLPATFKTLVSIQLAIDLGPQFGMSHAREDRLRKRFDDVEAQAKRADRISGSQTRYDGRDDDTDWVQEAVR